MEGTGFWSRVGGWLRSPGRSAVHGGQDPVGASPDSLAEARALTATREQVRDGGLGPPPKQRPARRDAAVERLEEGYNKVLGLIESIERHLEQQDQRSEAVTRSLDRIADALTEYQEGVKTQEALLTAINGRLESDGARAQRLEESLAQLPQLADAQREAMAAVSHQLDQSRVTSEQVGTAIDGFEQSVVGLGNAISSSTAAMHETRAEAAAGEERLTRRLEEQTRRFTFFACVAISVAVVVAIMGLVALLR